MTNTDAKRQLENFLGKLGFKDQIFAEKNHFAARIGEAFVGFEFDEAEELLSVQALIYRFRKEPKDRVLDAIFAEENEGNAGGGRIVFNSENFSFYLQKDFHETLDDKVFYDEVNRIATASLLWNSKIISQAAEKAAAAG